MYPDSRRDWVTCSLQNCCSTFFANIARGSDTNSEIRDCLARSCDGSAKPTGFCAAAFLEKFAAGCLKGEDHFVVIAEAFFRIFIHGAEDGAFGVCADISDDFARRRDARFHMGPNGFLHGVAIERNLAGEGVVEGGPQRIHV